jgi:hypothetical protein
VCGVCGKVGSDWKTDAKSRHSIQLINDGEEYNIDRMYHDIDVRQGGAGYKCS